MHRRPRRLLAAPLALLLAAAACGGDSGSDAGEPARPKVVGVVYDVGGLGDGGVNDLAFTAFGRAEDAFGLSVDAIEPDLSGGDRAELVRTLAGDRTGLVIALGYGARAAVEEVAKEHPDTAFVVVDDGVSTAANVTSVTFAEEQGAYLAGAAAAAMSSTKRIGFVGGRDDETTKRYQAGYTAGARAVDAAMKVDVAYLPAGGGALDPEQAKAMALTQLAAGSDLVFGAPRELGPPLAAAALERGGGARAIGVDVDAAEAAEPAVRSVVLTSMVKRFDVAMTEVLKRFVEGRLAPGQLRFGLARDGVELSVAGGLLSVEAVARVDELRQQILSGQVQVPTAP